MSSFGGCMWDVNDVTVWPGSSTSPPSDPRRETVWYGLAANRISGQQGCCGFSGDPILSTQRIPRSADPILSTQRICQINDLVKNLMGAMHQKIAIFKEEKSVWWGAKCSNITKWYYFLDELKIWNWKTKHVRKFRRSQNGNIFW